MQVSVTFRQMDPSDALRDYASRKLEHTVRKYIHAPIDAQATFSIEKKCLLDTLDCIMQTNTQPTTKSSDKDRKN